MQSREIRRRLNEHSRWIASGVLPSLEESCRLRLGGCNLKKATITNFNFTYAILLGVDLSESNLYSSKFYCSNCLFTSFRGANLQEVSFFRTDCRYVDFTEADLSWVIFTQCRLHGAIFEKTNLHKTKFYNCEGYNP